jgi:2,4-dienoyl-CoA reductase-like NADH-dependent reductase (Old Yellow Enzyme family)
MLTPLPLRAITLRNRIGVSPMCQYSSQDGFANDWHLVHLGSRAVGGAGLVIAEASAVEARGRITAADLGIWKDEHIRMLTRVASFIRAQGAAPAIQIAHAGRKASTRIPSEGGASVAPSEPGGWQTVAPSAIPFNEGDPVPLALSASEIQDIVAAFAAAAQRAREAGFDAVEIHSAHGYLLHEFLSPLSNTRTDQYGGPFENRIRMLLETAKAVRAVWPADLPLFVRISATDWVEGGWDADQSVRLAVELKSAGVDLIDCSSGGLVPHAKIPAGPGYQVPFAARIRKESGIMTAAVGMITDPAQAERIIAEGQADLVLMAREFLRDPYWPLHSGAPAPVQYARAYPKR